MTLIAILKFVFLFKQQVITKHVVMTENPQKFYDYN